MSARDGLIAAGARLFAERGIDAVSLREITREAGQRNATALQYHFADREGLLLAILDHHQQDVLSRSQALMDSIDAHEGPRDAREVIQVLALPLLHKLRSEGGPDFLQIASQLVNRATRTPASPREPLGQLLDDKGGTMRRWSAMIEPLMPPEVTGAPLHQRFAVIRFGYIELGRRAREGMPRGSDELFGAHLADLMTAMVVAPVSDRTRELLSRRRGTRITATRQA